ncbi:alpha/beta-hydrolase [Aulographum hederae CBS 113979]|uniref:Alpha/beta-hydrolase n=1 Tax=Aulographum hederae CBS 113979 TaxID=1176131 RepID=A0A6G1GSZ8_9PEZI|nr:alpha/beta-hydrolase [Aulographum hederae CBS 113979]
MSGPCCAQGTLHTHVKPTGRETRLHGVDCYVADGPNGQPPNGIVVILPDIFGWKLPNTRILADNYARKGGFMVLVPEFMDGHAMPMAALKPLQLMDDGPVFTSLKRIKVALTYIPPLFSLSYHTRSKVCQPKIFNWFKALRQNEAASLRIGVAGFCWGGRWVFRLAADPERVGGKPLVDCAYTGHPAQVQVPVDAHNVKIPLSISQSVIDKPLPQPKAEEVRNILMEKTKSGQCECEFVWFTERQHGFALRFDSENTAEAQDALKAEDQAVEWYKRWLYQ